MTPQDKKLGKDQSMPHDPKTPPARTLAPKPPVAQVPHSRPAVGSEQAISPRLVWDAIRLWWKWALPAGLLLAAAAVAVVYFFAFEPVYVATARIQIQHTPTVLVFPDRFNAQGGANVYVQRQLELINSWEILSPIVNDSEVVGSVPELQEVVSKGSDAVPWLRRRLKVAPVGRSDLCEISFESRNPSGAKRLVDAVVTEYLRQFEAEQNAYNIKILEVLEKEISTRSQEVQQVQRELNEKARDLPAGTPITTDRGLDPNRSLSQLEARLIEAEVEEEVQQAKTTAWRQLMEERVIEVPEAMIDARVEADAEVQRLKALIESQQARLAETEAVAAKGANDPRCEETRKEIARTEQQLADRRSLVRDRITDESQLGLQASQEDQLASMEYELQMIAAKKNLLRERYEAELAALGDDASGWLELKSEQDELDRKKEVLALMETRRIELLTEMGVPGRVKLRYLAPLPRAPVEIFPYRNAGFASLAALFAPFGLAVVWERLLRRLNSADHLEKQSHVKLLAEISRLPRGSPGGNGRAGKRILRELAMFEETIDTLRTNLLLAHDSDTIRVVAVTSAVSDEGKTSVAVQLARSIVAATGEFTLLVDGDLRRPDVHRVFEIPREPGLADVLCGECSFFEAVVTVEDGSLHVLPAGRPTHSIHRLFANGSIERLLEEIPDECRYVVIDTPPILAASEALMLAKSADVSIVCTRRDVSRVQQFAKACDRLNLAGAHVAGAVFSGVPPKYYTYRYGAYAYAGGEKETIS